MRTLSILLACQISLLPTMPVSGAVKTWKITGSVSWVAPTAFQGKGIFPFEIGDTFEHVFTVDDSVAASVTDDERADYPAIIASELSFPSQGLLIQSTLPINVFLRRVTEDLDRWRVYLNGPGLISTSETDQFERMDLSLYPPSPGFAELEPFPMVQPDLSWSLPDWTLYSLWWKHKDNNEPYVAHLSAERLLAVPEASSVALACLLGLALSSARWRK